MAWTVIARVCYDDDDGTVTTKVTRLMQGAGFGDAGTGLWRCTCDGEAMMQDAVDAVTRGLSGLDKGVTLDHLILNVFKTPLPS